MHEKFTFHTNNTHIVDKRQFYVRCAESFHYKGPLVFLEYFEMKLNTNLPEVFETEIFKSGFLKKKQAYLLLNILGSYNVMLANLFIIIHYYAYLPP